MKKKVNFHLKSKHILVILSIICVSLMCTTFSADFSAEPLRDGASHIVVPFEKGVNKIGDWLSGFLENFRDVKTLAEENASLHEELEALKEENAQLAVNQTEYERLRALYEVDEEYSEYDKVLAKVIAKEPGNWYSTFTIDKGEEDGIEPDMNVIAAGGLVGLVTETGSGWATVQTIVDDGNNISGMTLADSNTCIVTGSLELLDSGRMKFSQMIDDTGSVAVGENIITSHISDKYLEGILIGTISSIERDSNNLTCTGYLVPAVDFGHLQEVFVITKLKEQKEEDTDEE